MRRARFTTTPNKLLQAARRCNDSLFHCARVLEIVRHLVARRWRAALALAMARSQAGSHSNTPSRVGVDGRGRVSCPTRRLACKRLQEAATGSPRPGAS